MVNRQGRNATGRMLYLRGRIVSLPPMSQPLKILNVVGARPNLPKIAPLIREMQRHREVEPILVHTGQHYDANLSDIFFRQMGIPEPQVNLEVGSGSHAAQTGEILKRIEPVLLRFKPDLALVVGDVNSTIAVGLAAAKLGIPLAHVEAGLRSFDRSMPEEINRILTDAIADYLFVTEEDAIGHLLKEGRPREAIHFVGNVMIDSLRHFLPIAQQSAIGAELGLVSNGAWRRFAVLTLHRPSNVDSVEKLADLLGKATLVLTDSGGIQEETTALGVPCLTLRENTERPVTISQGTNLLVGTEAAKIIAAAREILGGHSKAGRVPPLWDGHAAERIVEILLRAVPQRETPAAVT